MEEEESKDLLLNPSTAVTNTPEILIDAPLLDDTANKSSPLKKHHTGSSSGSSGKKKKCECDSLSKEYALEYEDFDIDSYGEYSRAIRNKTTKTADSGSTSSLSIGNRDDLKKSAENHRPIMSSLCKLEKISSAKQGQASCEKCVRSYVIGKNEIQLETKPPVKVIIEPSVCENSARAASPVVNMCNICEQQQQQPSGGDGSKQKVTAASINPLLIQRGSIHFPDPIKSIFSTSR